MVVPGMMELYEPGDRMDTTGCPLSGDGATQGIVVGVSITPGVIVAFIPILFVTWEDDLTIQLRVDKPSFPALSLAVTRIMNVPETSAGTISE